VAACASGCLLTPLRVRGWRCRRHRDALPHPNSTSHAQTGDDNSGSPAVVVGKGPLQSRGMARVEEFLAYSNCSLNFFLAWTTAGDKFTLRYRRTLESTLKFHPTGCVVVYSPTLTLDYFQARGMQRCGLRIGRLGFGTGRRRMALERWPMPKTSLLLCSLYRGLQSCRRDWATVAKRPR
jgi:hypothetical protein